MSLISLEPEFIVDPSGTIHEGCLIVDGHNLKEIAATPPLAAKRVSLKHKMLLPGFINVHSHALQRALRGRVEQRSPQGLDDFWTWRTLMYQDAFKASLDDVEAIATLAYLEMIKSGFVAVGEFNYLHHQPSGEPYDDAAAISKRLVKAAQRVGIRLALLTCAYERKNHTEKLTREQKRFAFRNASEFLDFARDIKGSLKSPLLTHGVAAHSTRACSGPFIEAVAHDALTQAAPFHMHACEQTEEVKEAFDEYGHSPIEALKQFGALKSNTTLIHATHLTSSDVATIAESQSIVGLCPSTERNLGDGLCPVEDLWRAGVRLSIGTDQHVRLDPVQELREIEEQERLRVRKRCIIAEPGKTIAESLLTIGTLNGRHSLGLEGNSLWLGGPADLVAITLPRSYEVTGPLCALNEWLVAGSRHDVAEVFVDGALVNSAGPETDNEAEIVRNAGEALRRLTAIS